MDTLIFVVINSVTFIGAIIGAYLTKTGDDFISIIAASMGLLAVVLNTIGNFVYMELYCIRIGSDVERALREEEP